jgi:hypothetical protein
MIQSDKFPLFFIVLALSNLALLAPVNAVDPSNAFTTEGKGAGNEATTGLYDSAFGSYALHNVTSGYGNTASGAYALFANTDPKGTAQFGLVAEEVEKVNPHLVGRDKEGQAYTVRYEAVNAMLLNEFLKEHGKVEEQQRKQQALEATIVQQQAQIEALTAGLQKVSEQVALQKNSATIVAEAK